METMQNTTKWSRHVVECYESSIKPKEMNANKYEWIYIHIYHMLDSKLLV